MQYLQGNWSTPMTASPSVLEKRLRDVLALDGPFSKDSAREAIVREQIAGAMCARLPGLTGNFANWFGAVFGETIEGKEWKPKMRKKA